MISADPTRLKKTPLPDDRFGSMFMLPKTERITSIRPWGMAPPDNTIPESGRLKAPPRPPVSTATAQEQNQQNDYENCCRVHVVTPFLRVDWKLSPARRMQITAPHNSRPLFSITISFVD
jgi:hypothetical protein